VKGQTVVINGDRWTVVDVAPAQALAEMVAALLEDEGMVAMVRGGDLLTDVFSNLGASGVGSALVLVPEADAERALTLIDQTVTDFEGDELDAIMGAIAAGADPEELLGSGEIPPGEDTSEGDGSEGDDPA
jgi:malate/lactate dehydrogenase